MTFAGNKTRWIFAVVLSFACAGGFAQTTGFPGSTAVNQVSQPQSVTVKVTAAGTAATANALTQGLVSAEFGMVAGGSCAPGTAYGVGQQCTVMVVFQPKYPGTRSGAVVLQDAGGVVLGTAMVSGLGIGSLPVFTSGQIDTVAGDAEWLYQGDGGPATQTSIFLPTGVVTDGAGNLYLSDSQNNRIRKVNVATGYISTIAGTGTPGFVGDGGLANLAMVSAPAGLALDGAGNLYVADTGNHVIRRIDAFSGMITTVAGRPGVQGSDGDGGAATLATLSFPEGVTFDAGGNLLIADTGNNRIRRVDAVSGAISTVAGTGVAGFNGDGATSTASQLNSPWSLTVTADGTILVADLNNDRVRRISPSGIMSTIAGTGQRFFSGDGGSAATAEISEPTSVVSDPAGNVYFADSGNNRVRKVDALTNVISTVAGTGAEQFTGDGGPANVAMLYGPSALYLDSGGNLFVADMFHNRVRRMSAVRTTLVYPTMKVGKIATPPQDVEMTNEGNAELNLTAPLLVNAAEDVGSTTCAAGDSIGPAVTCVVGAEFAPTITGNPVRGTIAIESDSVYAAPVISMSGEVLSIQPTVTTLVSSANPSLLGATVTFTATVGNGGSGSMGGSVMFLDGTTQICNVPIGSAHTVCSTSALTVGSHNITASYSGDGNNAASVSAPLVQVVKQAPTLTLTVTPNPAVVLGNVTLTVVSSTPNGTITGTVSFLDGGTAINAATLSGAGGASFSTAGLAAGTHDLSVQYNGDTLNMAAQSNTVSEVVQQATTTTTLSTSNANAAVGTTVTFTALVVSAGGSTPTGTVSFQSGTTTLGTSAVASNGSATWVASGLKPGTYALVAVYSGNADDGESTSAPIVETIEQIATTTSLAADANPVAAGAALHLTATVSGGSSSGGALTGNVTFTEGATAYGPVTLDTTGHATMSVSTLSAGSHTFVASFTGNTNYAASASAQLVEVVLSTSTVVVLSSPAATTLAGETATFTATVSSSTSIPTGTVVFSDQGGNLGQAQLNAQGVATFSTTALTVGTHVLSAAYGGNASYNASTSPTLQHTVALATTALALAAPGGTVEAQKPFAMKATLSSNGVSPTGALTLRDGGATIGTQTIAADGTFNFANVTLGVGSHSLTAAYAGDSDNAPTSSPAVMVVVQLAPSATTLATNASPATLGQNVTFTSAVTSDSPNPTGSVTYMDGAVLLGSTAVGANGSSTLTLSTLALGTHTITAVYSGDVNHATSTSAALTQQIVQQSTAAMSSSANPSNAGANVTFTVTVSGTGSPAPTGTITFRDGTATIGTATLDGSGSATMQTSTLAVGSHTMSGSYGGDSRYSAAQASMIQTVQNATTQIMLTASANPATYLTPLVLTATVTDNGGVAAGSVTFTDGGVGIGSATLNGGGVATLTTSSLTPGTHSIVANYGGNGATNASSSTPLSVSVKQLTGIDLASNANPTPTLSPVVLTATVNNNGVGSATGSISFSDGAVSLGTAVLDQSGKATLQVAAMSAGTHALQASYIGDGADFASVSPVLSELVQLRPTTVSVTGSATDPANPQQVTLIAVVRWNGPGSPTGTVTFTAGSASVGTSDVDSTGVATITMTMQSATESIVATYSGDMSYAASTSAAATIKGGVPTQFTMQVDPSSVTFASKDHTTVDVLLTSLSGFSDTMQMGCLGLPFAATCTFSAPQMKLAANGTATAQLTIDTGDPLGAGASGALRGSPRSQGTSGVFLCLLPCLLGIGLRARRRKMGDGSHVADGLRGCDDVECGGLFGAEDQWDAAGDVYVQGDGFGRGDGDDVIADDDADGDAMRLAARLRWLIAAVAVGVACGAAIGQAIPTAKGPDSFTAIGGGVAMFESDYGQRLLGGALVYTDINPEWRVGFEGEARYLRIHADEDVTETNYFVGPRYVWRVWGFRPYAKFLVGAQKMTFPFHYAQGTFFTYAPGGGFEYAPGDRVILRVVDFEYQVTPAFASFGQLRPYGLSAGISWRLNARQHFPKNAERRRWH